MAEFNERVDYTIILKELLKEIDKYHLEYQLVWMWEAILIYTYLNLIENNYAFRYNVNNKRLVQRNAAFTYFNNLGFRRKAVECLSDFRNFYVHAGSSAAFNKFRDLFKMYKTELNQIATYLGIKLNWTYIAYLECGEKQKAKVEK